MNIREQIIKKLDVPCVHRGHYWDLKNCLILKPGTDQTGGAVVDDWFKGIIESLYYRPNKFVLVLESAAAIGKTHFLRHLVSNYWMASSSEMSCLPGLIYNFMFLDHEFRKKDLWLPTEDNFIVYTNHHESDMPITNKRLASYCTTTQKWAFPQRKNYIVLHLESINKELFNSIPKDLLWIEIFQKFKP